MFRSEGVNYRIAQGSELHIRWCFCLYFCWKKCFFFFFYHAVKRIIRSYISIHSTTLSGLRKMHYFFIFVHNWIQSIRHLFKVTFFKRCCQCFFTPIDHPLLCFSLNVKAIPSSFLTGTLDIIYHVQWHTVKLF